MNYKHRTALAVGASITVLSTAICASAQQDPLTAPTPQGDIVVIGTQIRGAQLTGALPVNVVSQAEMQAVAPVSSGDLFRTIPQLGDVSFNEQSTGGVNSTRGDVSSVSLRGLGLGNTLLLLNGRRMVLHPTSQAVTGIVDSQVPVFGYNANAIPVAGLERLEVLRDGAAALYGSDAVAGVVNNVLKSDFRGKEFTMRYGFPEGTSQREFEVTGIVGTRFAQDRGNISVFGSYSRRSHLWVSDLPFTATSDRRAFAEGTGFEGTAAFDARGNSSAWGTFRTYRASGPITQNGVAITDVSGMFHLQPGTNAGCKADSAIDGVCYGAGNITSGTANKNTRLDSARSFPHMSVSSQTWRLNLFSFLNYDLTDDLTFFGELGLYRAKTNDVGGSSGVGTSPAVITIAANAYYNPFGPVGSPNRIPGLDNVPAGGMPLTFVNYNAVDEGTNDVNVTNAQYRILGGLRGSFGDWNWETAALYNWATAQDRSDRLSLTLFQKQVNLTTPDAYNPFSGGDPANPSIGDSSPNPLSSITPYHVEMLRATRTSLALWDFKLSNARLLSLWDGSNIGIAAGVEFRREDYHDNRDARQDGTIGYVDAVTGATAPVDTGSSLSPDVRGKRNVWSAYAELAPSLVTPDMDIPLVRSIELQFAGRFERYSDVGSVAKPKIAGAWDPVDGIRFRSSWSGGFRAPNLEVINLTELGRNQGGIDYLLCEADLQAGRISSFSQCNRTTSMIRKMVGNPNLKPEESTSFSYGLVLMPPLPDGFGRLTFTVDRWRIKQKNAVGLVNAQDALTLDYMLRMQGSSNPDVHRSAPNADDLALFAGTSLTPTGGSDRTINIDLTFENFLPITVEGLDFGLDYQLRNTPLGSFSFNLNSAKLIRYFMEPGAVGDALAAGQAAGLINTAVPLTAGGDFVNKNGRPRWRHTANFTWRNGPVEIGAMARYINAIDIIDVVDRNNNPWKLKATTTVNLFGTYRFQEESGFLDGTSITLGVRDLFDKGPPFTPSNGYLASIYQPQARYWYASVKKSFR